MLVTLMDQTCFQASYSCTWTGYTPEWWGATAYPMSVGMPCSCREESGEWVTVETPKSQTNPSPFPATNCLVVPLESNQGRAVPLQPLLSLTVSTKGSPEQPCWVDTHSSASLRPSSSLPSAVTHRTATAKLFCEE